MSRTAWIIFAVICIALLGGLVWMSQGNRIDVSDVDAFKVQPPSEANGNIAEHTIGNPEAKVTIIEYADFQCPGCASSAPVMKAITEKYSDDVLFVNRNFPLSTGHANARAAAAAAEAAGFQDRYWDMHDRLYEAQRDWQSLSATQRTDAFIGYAREIGLDLDKFRQDLESPRITAKVNYDLALGRKVDVSSTPAIYVNGEAVSGYAKDGAIVSPNTEGGHPLWSDVTSFEELVLKPALEKAGVSVE